MQHFAPADMPTTSTPTAYEAPMEGEQTPPAAEPCNLIRSET